MLCLERRRGAGCGCEIGAGRRDHGLRGLQAVARLGVRAGQGFVGQVDGLFGRLGFVAPRCAGAGIKPCASAVNLRTMTSL